MSSTHITQRPLMVVDGDDEEPVFWPLSPSSPGYLAFDYPPLPAGDFIRILELLPGQNKDSLCCKIENCNLDAWNLPPYRALSYTWGQSKYDHLFVRGERLPMASSLRQQYHICHPLYCHDRRLLISTNLRDALHSLRHPSLPIKLWVDAVCINQNDDGERSSQIMLMPRIYHRASLVLFWLGEADDDAQEAFGFIRRYGPRMERFLDEVTQWRELEASTLGTRAAELGIPPVTCGAYASLLRLLDRPVFCRIWCVQEVAVGKSVAVRCGENSPSAADLTYTDIAHACAFLRKVGWCDRLQRDYVDSRDVVFFPTTVLGTRENGFMHRLDRSSLVFETRSFQASDPRDKVFALLGLLQDHSHRRLDTLGGASDDQCQDGRHSMDCLHMRQKLKEVAESKWERYGGLYPLWYAANSRIYGLVKLLSEFFETVENLLEEIRGLCADSRTITDTGVDALGRSRNGVDAKYIRIREFLDGISDKFVSSDELVAYRWASMKIERCVEIYDQVYTLCLLGGYNADGTEYPSPLLEEVIDYGRMMRREGDYASSSPTRSPDMNAEIRHGRVEKVELSPSPAPEGGDSEDESEGMHSSMEPEGLSRVSQTITRPSQRASPSSLVDSGDDRRDSSLFRESGEDPAPKDEHEDDANLADEEELSDSQSDDSGAWMAVGADEVPAELWLALHLSSQQDPARTHGVGHMDSRPDPERPAITSQPILPWGASQELLPDYSQSTIEVYTNFAAQSILSDQDLDILSTVDAFVERPRISGLPSWVPDFSVGLVDRIEPLVQPPQYRRNLWDASDDTKCTISWDRTNPAMLQLSGFCVDKIASVSELRANTLGLEPLHMEWQRMTGVAPRSFISISDTSPGGTSAVHSDYALHGTPTDRTPGVPSEHAPPPPRGASTWNDFLIKMMYPANSAETRPSSIFDEPWESYFAFLAYLRVQQSGADFSADIGQLLVDSGIRLRPHFPRITSDLIRVARILAVGRRMVCTVSGRVAFAPETAEEDDLIYIAKGGKVPIVLRRKEAAENADEDANTRFQFVGELYCQDMMKGQMVGMLGGDDAWSTLYLE